MKRKIIEIDEEKCNGCGICATACHEGAIEMVNNKAHLLNDSYCDGLGACLPECPTGAIGMVEKEAAAFDESLVQNHLREVVSPAAHIHDGGHVCPGSAARRVDHHQVKSVAPHLPVLESSSELSTWPIQLNLVNPHAPYLENADILVAADCTAFSRTSFHQEFIRGRVTLIGCPKLDDNDYYTQKLTEIFNNNTIHSIKVVRMEVPCCGGIVSAVKRAMLASGTIIPYDEVVIGIEGNLR